MTDEACDQDPGLEAKVVFLKDPSGYQEDTQGVKSLETHMSWVFLTDNFVYKIKKPVVYDYLDFRTIEGRCFNCREEVRLNRRLAESVYLGVIPMICDADGRMHLGGRGRVVDCMVKMRRLPAEEMLDHQIRKNAGIGEAEVCRVISKLTEFYRKCPPIRIENDAYRSRLVQEARLNLKELSQPACSLPVDQIRGIVSRQLAFLSDEAQLFDARVRAGRIVEAHGDLRPEHVCTGQKPVIIDCLEFKREFRILDTAEELAFLALECKALGAASVGERFFETYQRFMGDHVPDTLKHFYTSNRACLRAKLAARRALEDDSQDRTYWLDKARTYLRMAEAAVTHL